LTGHKRRRKKADVSKLVAIPVDPQVVVQGHEHVIEAVSQPPVLITEHEVAYGTAVALSLPRRKHSRSVLAAMRGRFGSASADDAQPTPHHYPPRCDFLEHAEMEREMRRL
jgi:hypothetical protein